MYANSRDVAQFFEKEHKHVMRDIQALEAALTVQNWTDWFCPATFNRKVGFGHRDFPAYDMTRDGFALLAMGFTGSKACPP